MSKWANEERAEAARAAVVRYATETRIETVALDTSREVIHDLFCDLCHLAVDHGVNPFAEVESALACFIEERTEGGGIPSAYRGSVTVKAKYAAVGGRAKKPYKRFPIEFYIEAARLGAANET
jgi:hypothetical protein